MKKFFWNYGLAILALIFVVFSAWIWLSKLGVMGTLLFVISIAIVSMYAYVNGWHRGRFEAVEAEKEITQKVENASSVRRKNKPKARR